MAGLLAGTAVAVATSASGQPDGSVDARVEALLARMTLAEKVGQLNLVSNQPPFDPSTMAVPVAAGRIGGVMNFSRPADVGPLQAAARGSRLGIPLLFGSDVVHGFRTIFPVPLGEAASFDPGLARRNAELAAREARAGGLNWTFAPVADLSRDPRWGRIVEGSGEDPLLNRVFTRARVEGFRAGGLAATLKHFAGYGAPVGGRDYDNTIIAPADLHDSFLPPFRAGVEAGSESVMAGLHALNGMPSAGNRALLTDPLRARWGFRGFVVSDWDGVKELINHGVAANGPEATRKALLAGIDMDMESRHFERYLPDEVAAGRVPLRAVDEAVRRVLRTKFAMGLFDRPDVNPADPDPPGPSPAMREAARAAARDSVVLLRNEGALPLAEGRHVALIGGIAGSGRELAGPHAAAVRHAETASIAAVLAERGARGGGRVTFVPGCDAECRTEDGFSEAVAAAEAADLVVAVLGEPLEETGEAASRANLRLPGLQPELLRRLLATGKPVVLVLVASRPLEIAPVADRLAAILMAWYPGTEGGAALADLLFGDHSPSAKLPVTWPRSVGQVPLAYDALPSGRPTDPNNRFTMRYVDEATTPLFPFGHGLSYTRFAYSDLRIAVPDVSRAGTLEVSVRIDNVGPREGREVAQLYIRQRVASRSRPLRQLKAFRKLHLLPGQGETVTFRIPAAELGFHREDGTYAIEPGPFEVFVGPSSAGTLTGTFALRE